MIKNSVIILALSVLFVILDTNDLNAETNDIVKTITSINIADSNNAQGVNIINPDQINRFNYYWSQKQPIKKQHSYQWRYQIDFETQSGKNRWVYDTNGYTRKVSMDKSSTIFKLSAPRAINRFIKEHSLENS